MFRIVKSYIKRSPTVKSTLLYAFNSSPVVFIRELVTLFRLNESEKKIVNHNKNVWGNFLEYTGEGEVLMDTFPIPESVISYSYLGNILALNNGAKLRCFVWGNDLIPAKTSLIFKSFNTRNPLRVKLTSIQRKELKELDQSVVSGIKSKNDVYNINIEDCHIGLDIYESYLRDYYKPTVDINDKNLRDVIKKGLTLYIFWRDYIKSGKVKAFILSHDCYIWMNICCRLAYKYQIPVYLPNARGAAHPTRPFSIHSFYGKYPELFSGLSEDRRREAKKISERDMSKRFSGDGGVHLHYSTASSFGQIQKERVLSTSDKTKVLVATHCFYDNPHAYSEFPFLDFYEWLLFLGEMSEQTDYEWYIKVHPDPLEGTMDNINKVVEKYPKIKVVHYSTSHLQLIKEGIDVILTGYGTVGEEYPYFGIPVINAAYNPRVAYSFNYTAKSLEDYKELIHNIPNLNFVPNRDEMYEFYYTHRYINWYDNLIFRSYYNFLETIKPDERLTGQVYEYYLKEFDNQSHEKRIKVFKDFVESKKVILIESGSYFEADY